MSMNAGAGPSFAGGGGLVRRMISDDVLDAG
jgi:hypothetical protein